MHSIDFLDGDKVTKDLRVDAAFVVKQVGGAVASAGAGAVVCGEAAAGAQLQSLLSMGFLDAQARAALEAAGGDVARAANYLAAEAEREEVRKAEADRLGAAAHAARQQAEAEAAAQAAEDAEAAAAVTATATATATPTAAAATSAAPAAAAAADESTRHHTAETTHFMREYAAIKPVMFQFQHQVLASVFGLARGHQCRNSTRITEEQATEFFARLQEDVMRRVTDDAQLEVLHEVPATSQRMWTRWDSLFVCSLLFVVH
jgi:hypothetical protein